MASYRRSIILFCAMAVVTTIVATGSAVAAPPAPTSVTLRDANDPAAPAQPDGWVNASEEQGVFVAGSYDTTGGIIEIQAMVSQAISVDAQGVPQGCDPAQATPAQTVAAQNGAFSIGPFDVDQFAEGKALCAIARARDGTSGSADALSTNYKIKDTVAPAPPTIDSPANNSKVSATPTFQGAGEAGNTVSLVDLVEKSNGALIGAAPVDAISKRYSLRVNLTKNGDHSVHTVAVDAAKNTSAPSNGLLLNVDAGRPTIAIDSPDDLSVFPPGEPVHVTGTARDAYSGVHRVVLRIYDGYTVNVNSTTTPPGVSTGKWVEFGVCGGSAGPCPGTINEVQWTFDASFLPSGNYSVQALAYDLHGNQSGPVHPGARFVKLSEPDAGPLG